MPTATRPGPELIDLAARYFPLLPRTKPLCRPLPDRVARVQRQAETAARQRSLDHAAKALNLAALIYSDSTMQPQAQALCWRQFEVFAAGGPYDKTMAKTAIQPLVNLGRLHTRAGDGSTAYQLHQAMLHAVRHHTPTEIDGRTLDLAAIAEPGQAHSALTQTLWMVLLSDGLRALCRSGQWEMARQQAQTHHGIGTRLLDGRQTAIIAAAIRGEHRNAHTLIDTAAITEPWERCAAACLRVLTNALAANSNATDIATMLKTYDALDVSPEHTLFLTKAGLAITGLIHNHNMSPVIRKIEQVISGHADAYPAAELITYTPPLPLNPHVRGHLTETVAAAGLGRPLPAELDTALADAAAAAFETIAAIISPR